VTGVLVPSHDLQRSAMVFVELGKNSSLYAAVTGLQLGCQKLQNFLHDDCSCTKLSRDYTGATKRRIIKMCISFPRNMSKTHTTLDLSGYSRRCFNYHDYFCTAKWICS